MDTTNRSQLIRAVRRCLADLNGGHVWRWTVERLRSEAEYTLRLRRGELARDEVVRLSALVAESK